MPITNTSHYRVRHYECDANGHLNHANYLRYMEEAAFEASAAVGYSRARFEALGTLWLARETYIEYLHPLYYGDEVRIVTWAADFRQVRSIRKYEFYRGEELVAQAQTDWVYLDRQTGRPATIPPEMIRAFSGDGAVETLARPAFPQAPPAPAGVFELAKRVEWRDIDTAQHVNNAVYLSYAEDAGWQVAAHYGWPVERCMAEGFGIVARSHHIEYRQPARMDDELTIATYVFNIRRFAATRYFQIKRDDSLLAQVRTLWVWIDLETGKPKRIPESFAADFGPNIAPE